MQLAVLTNDALTTLAGEPLAAIAPFNPLAHDPADAVAMLPDAPLILAWSGTLADSLFARDFQTWMPAGRAALTAYLDAAEPILRDSNRRLLLRTHARHVISDFVAAKALLAERPDSPIAVALDPAACFEASMLTDADDHLVRTFSQAARADVIILRSLLQPREKDNLEGPPPEPCPLGDGLFGAATLGALVRQHAADDAIVAVAGPDPEAQFRRAGLL